MRLNLHYNACHKFQKKRQMMRKQGWWYFQNLRQIMPVNVNDYYEGGNILNNSRVIVVNGKPFAFKYTL